MEIEKELANHDQRAEVASFNLPSIGAMQLAATSGFGHNIEIISHACQARPKNTNFDIEEGDVGANALGYGALPIYLKFEDVEYKLWIGPKNPVRAVMKRIYTPMCPNGGEGRYKPILKGITGSVGPGEILALMGPSGSGKTTLLKIIGGRFRDNVKGGLTYNDIPYSPALKRRIGFVTQDDVLFPQLTVEETLVFAALLRLPSNMSRQQKLARAEKTLKELGLERCRHTRVGGGFVKGISGGERKRTSIGYEILVDPSLLLLDEPTSGLDSTSANRLLQILQALAQAGRTVITTIHQPSSRMFYMFDKLLLISKGYPIFYGRARESIEYFASLRFVPELAMNPAEFLLDLAAGHMSNISIPDELKLGQEAQNQDKFPIKYLHSRYREIIEPKEKDENHKSKSAPSQLQIAVQVKKDWTMSWWDQFFVLWKRTYRERCIDYFDKLRVVQAIGVALLLGLLWWKSKIATEAELRDQIGLMFYVCIFWTTSSIFGAVYVFPFESMYLTKEKKADMYRLSVYYACSTLCDMMAHLLYPTVFMSILYFMADFKRTVPCFFLTLLSIFLIVITSQGVGELFGAAVMSIKRSGMMASLILMLFLLTGGYYVQHIPVFMHWLKYISFVYYGFRLLLKVQYSADQVFECQSAGGCRSLQTSQSFSTVELKGGLLEVWVLLAMAVSFRLAAYACLRKRITASTI